jgi:hypothetical protein
MRDSSTAGSVAVPGDTHHSDLGREGRARSGGPLEGGPSSRAKAGRPDQRSYCFPTPWISQIPRLARHHAQPRVHCCASLSIRLGAAEDPAASHTVTTIPMIPRTMVVTPS